MLSNFRVNTTSQGKSLVVAVSTVLLCVYAVDLWFTSSPGFDQSWYLYVGDLILHGAQLYSPEAVEANPPMMVWFSAILDAISKLLQLSPLLLLKATAIAGVVISSFWCSWIVSRTKLVKARALLYLNVAFLLAVESSTFWWDFGQREHFLILMVLPYIFFGAHSVALQANEWVGEAERYALGIAAGIGFCFKPQHAMLLMGFELFAVAWTKQLRRVLRIECIAAGSVVFLFILVVYFRTSYVQQTVPLLLDTFWGFAEGSRSHFSLSP